MKATVFKQVWMFSFQSLYSNINIYILCEFQGMLGPTDAEHRVAS